MTPCVIYLNPGHCRAPEWDPLLVQMRPVTHPLHSVAWGTDASYRACHVIWCDPLFRKSSGPRCQSKPQGFLGPP